VNIPEGAESARYPVQAVERALSIVNILADSPGLRPLGVTEIAAQLGVSKSTAHRLLTTLAEFNFVARGVPAGKYRLGWAVYQVAHRLPHATGVHALAQPLMRAVCDELGETVNLAVRFDSRLVVVESQGLPGLRVETPRGIPCPLHNCAAGKALLLDLELTTLADLVGSDPLPRTSPRTITGVRALHADLVSSRKRGYTLDDEECDVHIRCVGAPVRDHHGEIVASVSVTGPAHRLVGPKLDDAGRRLHRLALEISQGIGFAGESTI
jgi:DNA-binding IclR family transcriptional regulator